MGRWQGRPGQDAAGGTGAGGPREGRRAGARAEQRIGGPGQAAMTAVFSALYSCLKPKISRLNPVRKRCTSNMHQ